MKKRILVCLIVSLPFSAEAATVLVGTGSGALIDGTLSEPSDWPTILASFPGPNASAYIGTHPDVPALVGDAFIAQDSRGVLRTDIMPLQIGIGDKINISFDLFLAQPISFGSVFELVLVDEDLFSVQVSSGIVNAQTFGEWVSFNTTVTSTVDIDSGYFRVVAGGVRSGTVAGMDNLQFTNLGVPEPQGVLLLIMGVFGSLFRRRRFG